MYKKKKTKHKNNRENALLLRNNKMFKQTQQLSETLVEHTGSPFQIPKKKKKKHRKIPVISILFYKLTIKLRRNDMVKRREPSCIICEFLFP